MVRTVTNKTHPSTEETMPTKKKKDDITKTNIYLPTTVLRELRLIAMDVPGRMSVNSVIVGILNQYLRDRKKTADSVDAQLKHDYHLGESDPPGIPEEFRKWVAYLIYILTEKNEYATSAIKTNLDAFMRLTKLDRGENAPPPDEPVENSIERALEFADRSTKAAQKHLLEHSDVRPGRRRMRTGGSKVA